MGRRIKSFLKILGPGIITGASDDDPSGIATYSQAGAAAGLSLLWTSPFTFFLMSAIQEMCARIGLATGHGLAGVLKRYYSIWITYLMAVIVLIVNTINIGANLAGMSASVGLVIPLPPIGLSLFFATLISLLLVAMPYHKIVSILKWLTIALFAYFIVPFIVKIDWWLALKSTLIPSLSFNKTITLLLVAILGTTISPYLFFWQASVEVEDKLSQLKSKMIKRWIVTKHEVRLMEEDITLGMLLSNLTMWFIIATTALTLHINGISNIETAAQAAGALEPIAGRFASLLFALGIIGTGLLAIPVLAGSASYILSEAFGWQGGLDEPFHKAKRFYLVIIFSTFLGLLINFLNLNPFKMLFYTAVIYGIVSPFLIAVILHIANNSTVMGKWKNGWLSNFLGFVTFLIMSGSVIVFVTTTFFNR